MSDQDAAIKLLEKSVELCNAQTQMGDLGGTQHSTQFAGGDAENHRLMHALALTVQSGRLGSGLQRKPTLAHCRAGPEAPLIPVQIGILSISSKVSRRRCGRRAWWCADFRARPWPGRFPMRRRR